MSVLTRPGGPSGPASGAPGGPDGPGDGGGDRPPRGPGRQGPGGAGSPGAGGRPAARPAVARAPAAPGTDVQADAVASIALCALTLASVYSLSRLFAGGSYVGPVVTMAIVMHAVAWGCRRQGLRAPAAVAVSVGSFVLLLAWLVVPETTRYGLPLTATLRAAQAAAQAAGNDFHSVVAPAPVTKGFLFITVAAVGCMALIADWAAFRMRATLEAAVPSFTLFVFDAALGVRQHRTATVAVELAALLAFVVVHQVTVNQDGAAWFAGRTTGALTSAIQVGAVLGAVAILAGVVVGPALPGAGSRALILWRSADRGGGNGTRTIPSPLVDLRTRLIEFGNVEVFTVKSTVPEYWRLTSLDSFNGVEWSSDNSYNTVSHKLPGASTPTPGLRVEQDVSITGPISSIWLPAAYEADRIDGVAGVSYNAESGSLITDHDTTTGLTYHVSSVITVGQLNPQKLQSAGPLAGVKLVPKYTKLPSIPQEIIDLARQVTAGKTTEYDKAKALQDYLRSPPFTYDDTFTLGDGSDALSQFLFKFQRGYCQQFAGAYAVMARALGIPTRVAVGFSYGAQDATGLWHVKDSYSHAWPEVYFPGSGWVPFEPTPGRGIPGAQQYTGQPQAEQGSPPVGPAAPRQAKPSAQTPSTQRPSGRLRFGESNQVQTVTPAKAVHHASSAAALVWLGLLAAAVALWVGGVGGTWWLRRRWRRSILHWYDQPDPTAKRRGSARPVFGLGPRRPDRIDPAVPVLVAWIDVVELLAWWGTQRGKDETYQEFARRAAHDLRYALALDRDAGAALVRLARDASAAEYAPGVLTPESASQAAESVNSINHALIAAADFKQRLRLAVDPRLVFGEAARRRTRAARAARAGELSVEPA